MKPKVITISLSKITTLKFSDLSIIGHKKAYNNHKIGQNDKKQKRARRKVIRLWLVDSKRFYHPT